MSHEGEREEITVKQDRLNERVARALGCDVRMLPYFNGEIRYERGHCWCGDGRHGVWSGGGSDGLKRYSTDLNIALEAANGVLKGYGRKVWIETYGDGIWTIKPCGVSSRSLAEAICEALLKEREDGNVG